MTDDGCFRFFLKLHNIFIYSYTCSLKFHYSFHPTKLWINQRCYIHQEWKVLFLPILDKDTQGYICLLSVSRTDDVLCFLPPNSCRILNSDQPAIRHLVFSKIKNTIFQWRNDGIQVFIRPIIA